MLPLTHTYIGISIGEPSVRARVGEKKQPHHRKLCVVFFDARATRT